MKYFLAFIMSITTNFFVQSTTPTIPTLQVVAGQKVADNITNRILDISSRCNLSEEKKNLKMIIESAIGENSIDLDMINQDMIAQAILLKLGVPEYSFTLDNWIDYCTFDHKSHRFFFLCSQLPFYTESSHMIMITNQAQYYTNIFESTQMIPSPSYSKHQKLYLDTTTKDLFILDENNAFVMQRNKDGKYLKKQTLSPKEGHYYCPYNFYSPEAKINEVNHTFFVPARDDLDMESPFKLYAWKQNDNGYYALQQIITLPGEARISDLTLNTFTDEIYIKTVSTEFFTLRKNNGQYQIINNMIPSSIAHLIAIPNHNQFLAVIPISSSQYKSILIIRQEDGAFHYEKTIPQSLKSIFNISSANFKSKIIDILFFGKNILTRNNVESDSKRIFNVYSSTAEYNFLVNAPKSIKNLTFSQIFLLSALLIQGQYNDTLTLDPSYEDDFRIIIKYLPQGTLHQFNGENIKYFSSS